MLDLSDVTDELVAARLAKAMSGLTHGTDSWRVLGFCSIAQHRYSFSATRTYPRPDHPDPAKRLPLVYLMVGILVSLRTTLENEQRAMDRLISRFPTEGELLRARADEIAGCISCAGMADTKSTRIRSALDRVLELDGGLEGLASRSRDEARGVLLGLPGFGPKAADCMLTIGLGIPSMVVDVNVFRVASALLGLPWSGGPNYSNEQQVQEVKRQLDQVVGDDPFLCQIVHTLLLLHGKHRRIRAHESAACELGEFCRSCELDPARKSIWTQCELPEIC
jgi:endonuclease III